MKKMLVILLALFSMGFAISAFAGQGWDISFQNNSLQTNYYISPINHFFWYVNDLGKTIEVGKDSTTWPFYTESDAAAYSINYLLLGVYDNATICDSNLVGVIVIYSDPGENYQTMLNNYFLPYYANTVCTLATNATTHQADGYDHNINLSPWMYFAAPFSGNPTNATIVLT